MAIAILHITNRIGTNVKLERLSIFMLYFLTNVYIAFHCYDIITYEILVKKSHVADT